MIGSHTIPLSCLYCDETFVNCLGRFFAKPYLQKFVLFLEGNIYYISVNIIKPEGVKKHFLSGKPTYVVSVIWIKQNIIKWPKKRKKNTIILKIPSWRDSTSPLPFCWKFTVSHFFPLLSPSKKQLIFVSGQVPS